MDALPQVGQKYQHKKWGEVTVQLVNKRGRGYTVVCVGPFSEAPIPTAQMHWIRLKDFQKATA